MAEMNGCSCCATGEEGVSTANPPSHSQSTGGGEGGKGTHIMRAVVVAVCVKEDAESSEIVSRTKHRPWASGKMKGVST